MRRIIIFVYLWLIPLLKSLPPSISSRLKWIFPTFSGKDLGMVWHEDGNVKTHDVGGSE